MKLEAIKYQGRATSGQLVQKVSVEIVGDEAGENYKQVKRYIRLTYLHPDLLRKVDEEKIAFNPAVELSFLTIEEQAALLDAMEQNDCTPSHAQAIRMKKMSQDGMLTDNDIYDILAEEKPNQQPHLRFKREDFAKYFAPDCTEEQMCKDIIKGLELLKRQRERNRDAR